MKGQQLHSAKKKTHKTNTSITIRGYTYTRPVHYHQKIHLHNTYRGSSYTAPSKYTTVRICAYTIPKGEQLQSAETIH